MFVEAGGATYWLAEGWLFLSPKQLLIHPKKPLLEFVPGYVWLEVIWAEANPTMVSINISTATRPIIIFVFCIYHHITIWSWDLMAVW